jgi:hypothetical protein
VVTRDVLSGVVIGAAGGLLFQIRSWIALVHSGVWITPALETLLGIRHTFGVILSELGYLVYLALGTFCFLFLARVLVRKEWLAALLVFSFYVPVGAAQFGFEWGITMTYVVQVGIATVVLLRLSVLPLVVGMAVSDLFSLLPVTLDWGAWYGTPTIIAFATVIALMCYALRFGVARAPRSGQSLLES